MNQKKKIIVIFSSLSLGLAIVLDNFLQKDNSQKEQCLYYFFDNQNNHQRLKKKTFFVSAGSLIIYILIIVIIYFFVREIHYCYFLFKKKCLIKSDIHQIKIYFCDYENSNDDKEFIRYIFRSFIFDIPKKYKVFEEKENDDHHLPLDISEKKEDKYNSNTPQELQKIYLDLQAEKIRYCFFYQLHIYIKNFFKLLDSVFLLDVEDYFAEKNLNLDIVLQKMISSVNYYLCLRESNLKICEIYNQDIFYFNDKDAQEIEIPKNVDALDFFKQAVTNKKIFYYRFERQFETEDEENKKITVVSDGLTYLFKHYYTIYHLIERIYNNLLIFFEENKHYQKKYQEMMTIKQKIDECLRVDKPIEIKKINRDKKDEKKEK